MKTIYITRKPITKINADVLVNAANEELMAGGGVCGAIFAAAGHKELQEACDKIGYCDPGSAVITPGFKLCKYIIHAVGPRYKDGKHNEDSLLYSCYKKSLDLAKSNNCNDIVFPLISAGIFGYPAEEAFYQAIKACKDWLNENDDSNLKIIFSIPEENKYNIGITTAKKLEIDILTK